VKDEPKSEVGQINKHESGVLAPVEETKTEVAEESVEAEEVGEVESDSSEAESESSEG
jgi:hypothetical protein